MIRAIKVSIHAAILAAILPITAFAETFDYRFDVRLGMAKIGEMQVAANNDGKAYSTGAVLFTTGLVGAVYDVRYDYRAEGRIGVAGVLVPTKYTAENYEKDKVSLL